jgi:hypothetical protein
MRNAEQLHDNYRFFRQIHTGGSSESKLTQLEVPATWPDPSTRNDDHTAYCDPKHYESTGHHDSHHWKTVTNPNDIEFLLRVHNRKHFGQADNTPFAEDPLSSLLPWTAESSLAQDTLSGDIDADVFDGFSSTIRHILTQCKTYHPEAIPAELTLSEFQSKLEYGVNKQALLHPVAISPITNPLWSLMTCSANGFRSKK